MKKKLISICLFLSLLLPIFSLDNDVHESENKSQECERLTVEGVDSYRRFIAYQMLSEKNRERLAFETDESLREVFVEVNKDDVIQLAPGEFSVSGISDSITVEFIDDKDSTDVSKLVLDKLQDGYCFGDKITVDITEENSESNYFPFIASLPLCYYVKEFITEDEVIDGHNIFEYGVFYLKEGKLYLDVSNFID